jgi:DNA-directed RNA polymerase, mitochondrial
MSDLDRTYDRLNRQEQSRARIAGDGTTKSGQALARRYLPTLAGRIRADRVCPNDRQPWRALKDLDADALALRLVVNGISVSGDNKFGVNRDGDKTFRDQALWLARNIGIKDSDRELLLRVGTWSINMLLTLPIFVLGADDVLSPSEAAIEFVGDFLAQHIKSNPLLSPLTEFPEPWTEFRRGGLPADHFAHGHVSLIRTHNRSIERAVREAISTGQMQRVLDALNYLQKTKLAINEPVLDFVKRLGPKQDAAIGERLVWNTDLATAEAMAGHDWFCVPQKLEFRGRINSVCHFNFQRQDYVRGLFQFADGEPIGARPTLWLMSHVAACADKNSFSKVARPSELHPEHRVFWVEDNIEVLKHFGNAVLRGKDPASLDWPLPSKTPVQFVAACAELVRARENTEFPTRLPITMDASNSGLQQLSAMVRCEVGGRYSNLIPSKEGEDFYRHVAQAAWNANPDIRALMQGEFDREIAKQPAMTYFYGSVAGGWAKSKSGKWAPYGMTKQVCEVLEERGLSTKGGKELAHALYAAVGDTVPRVVAACKFLKHLADACSDHDKHLRWTTPLGLPVINAYKEPDTRTLSVSINGRRRRVNLTVGDLHEIDDRSAVNAVIANFVHSSDACHLHMIANAAEKEAIPLVSIHDCFGTIAPKVGGLLNTVRDQFVRLHKRHNLLNEVRESARRDLPKTVKLPALPEIGSLDIDSVRFTHHGFK